MIMVHSPCNTIIAESVISMPPRSGMLLASRYFKLADTGEMPKKGSPIICPHCKQHVNVSDITFLDHPTEK